MATVKYSVSARKNPSDPESAPRYYANAQSSGVQSLEDMSKVIEKNCTLTSTDVMAVLHAMDEVMRDQLCNGQIVRIGDLGFARLSLSSKGCDVEKDFDASLIKSAHVIFTPSPNTRKALKTLVFMRVPKLTVKTKKEPVVNN